jgi:hypothetical protein
MADFVRLREHPGDMVRLACTKCERRDQLLLDAAERNGSVDAVRRQVIFALWLDGKLDAAATAPAG